MLKLQLKPLMEGDPILWRVGIENPVQVQRGPWIKTSLLREGKGLTCSSRVIYDPGNLVPLEREILYSYPSHRKSKSSLLRRKMYYIK